MNKNLQKLITGGKKRGANAWKCTCPAHNDPIGSLSITLLDGVYVLHCFGGCSYKEVIEAAGLESSNLVVEKRLISSYVYKYADGKIAKKKDRYFPKNFYTYVKEGKKWRIASKIDKPIPQLLYRLPEVVKAKEVILVEGEKCVERLEQAGFVATTSGNHSSWRKSFVKDLAGKTVFILPDNDKVGRAYAQQAAEDLTGAAWVSIINLPGRKDKADVVDFLEDHSPEDIQNYLDSAEPYRPNGLVRVSDLSVIVMPQVLSVGKGVKKLGLPTGYKKLDEWTGGFAPELWILAARPGTGKTCLALNFIQNNPEIGNIAFFSLEMNDMSLFQRDLSYRTGVSLRRLRTGNITDKEAKKIKNVKGQLNCFLDSRSSIDVEYINTQLDTIENPDLVIIDYLQIMKMQNDNRNLAVQKITQELGKLAKERGCNVLALSQLSRNCENREPPKPRLSDLRDSGSIENDGYVVMFLYREKDSMGFPKTATELLIAKNKNGPLGSIPLVFDKRRMRFNER